MSQPAEKYDYGRQPLRNYVEEKLSATTPSCEKCRALTIRNEHCVCGKGHALDARKCGEFSDASVQTNYYPHFQYDGRFRR